MNTTLRLSHQKVKIADTDAVEFTPDALTSLIGVDFAFRKTERRIGIRP